MTIDYASLMQEALDFGFTNAAKLDTKNLKFLPEVREMCAANRCQAYGKNWMCPPAIGTIEQMSAKAAAYQSGILVQFTGQLEDSFDYENMQAAMQSFSKLFVGFAERLKDRYDPMFPMGAGACTTCPSCNYPEPCRFPDKAFSSLEACGLVVTQVCLDCGAKYNYGPNTITYSGAFLI